MLADSGIEEIDSENVIECIYDLSELDKEILSLLSGDEELRSSEIAERINKDQSTAYRSLEKLSDCGLIYKEKHNIRNGGYYFLYSRRPLEKIKQEARKTVDRWYEEVVEAVQELNGL
ncbi:MAG: ArsR family transcriptional regulator [Candidatus Thermoplasmatota archaeon]|nr:ArsR family transcriptional regulator [Candidatus Thermoplasmatota archaeon]MBS3789603.1 ArsR family transcriptional regulator [Candidatus Thermoplasmatota archaeon]